MRVYLESLGCRLNAAEIETLARQFAGAGHDVVQQPRGADVIVLNSCAVTSQASRSSRHRIRALHRDSPDAKIAVLGCWATEDLARARRLAGVRWVIPNVEKSAAVTEILGMATTTARWAPGRWGHTRAFLGVQDGCDEACTYCVTRILRGPAKSRPLAEVVATVQELVASGAQEIVLTGVCLGAYGQDRGIDHELAALVRAILHETGVSRLRLSSIEPWDITPELLDLWQDGRLCRQLHMPLQSGSDVILKRMGRRITVSGFLALVTAARAVQPEMALTTDLIAGFPGETEADFAETIAVVKEVGFSRLHVFPYSQRAGTAAMRLPDQVPKAIRKARAGRLRDLGQALAAVYQARFAGAVLPVLWEQRAGDDDRRRGLTDNYLAVVSRDSRARFNTITATKMVAVDGDVLIGEVVDG
ncbi:MAG: tRNA (N(6)-L-threonylcarbamoyladenosine(37)-C(2))-methylthiotransferase MtaB [Anaerolineae bacterium]|nr:tRNA (N(6)-L-threonylcarbamoyladenosine(37)-C(2))-methylthiotransferase MtaB [Anaerolineae bacterium]